jgi:transcriptional adapter 2-alpha
MKPFARFNSPDDHEKLVNSLLKERLLREVIEQLKFFKAKGLKTLEEIEKYVDSSKKSHNAAGGTAYGASSGHH